MLGDQVNSKLDVLLRDDVLLLWKWKHLRGLCVNLIFLHMQPRLHVQVRQDKLLIYFNSVGYSKIIFVYKDPPTKF